MTTLEVQVPTNDNGGTASSSSDGGNDGVRGRGTNNGAKDTCPKNGAGVQAPMTVPEVKGTDRRHWRYWQQRQCMEVCWHHR